MQVAQQYAPALNCVYSYGETFLELRESSGLHLARKMRQHCTCRQERWTELEALDFTARSFDIHAYNLTLFFWSNNFELTWSNHGFSCFSSVITRYIYPALTFYLWLPKPCLFIYFLWNCCGKRRLGRWIANVGIILKRILQKYAVNIWNIEKWGKVKVQFRHDCSEPWGSTPPGISCVSLSALAKKQTQTRRHAGYQLDFCKQPGLQLKSLSSREDKWSLKLRDYFFLI